MDVISREDTQTTLVVVTDSSSESDNGSDVISLQQETAFNGTSKDLAEEEESSSEVFDGAAQPVLAQTNRVRVKANGHARAPSDGDSVFTSQTPEVPDDRIAPYGGCVRDILVAIFCNYIGVCAIWYSFSVLYKEYASYFNTSLARIGVLASVEASAMHFTGRRL